MNQDAIKNYITGGEEEKVNDILMRLEFIASLKINERFNPFTLEIRDGSYTSRALRTLSVGENRWSCYEFIQKTVNEGIQQLYHYRNKLGEFYSNVARELYKSLKECEKGIESQMKTYKECRKLVSTYSTLLKLMRAKIDTESRLLKRSM